MASRFITSYKEVEEEEKEKQRYELSPPRADNATLIIPHSSWKPAPGSWLDKQQYQPQTLLIKDLFNFISLCREVE